MVLVLLMGVSITCLGISIIVYAAKKMFGKDDD